VAGSVVFCKKEVAITRNELSTFVLDIEIVTTNHEYLDKVKHKWECRVRKD
jgi:hypothetical protein